MKFYVIPTKYQMWIQFLLELTTHRFRFRSIFTSKELWYRQTLYVAQCLETDVIWSGPISSLDFWSASMWKSMLDFLSIQVGGICNLTVNVYSCCFPICFCVFDFCNIDLDRNLNLYLNLSHCPTQHLCLKSKNQQELHFWNASLKYLQD